MRFLTLLISGLAASAVTMGQCQLSLSALTTDASCKDSADGSADLTIKNGSAPYIITWSNGSTTEDVSGLKAGEYSVFVTDSEGCTAEAVYTIREPSVSHSISQQPLPQTDCYGNQAEFSVTATGTTGTVSYQWQEKIPGGSFTNIPGAVTSTYTISQIGVNGLNINGTYYRVLITDQCGTLLSDSSLLKINSIKSITPVVVNSKICSGGSIAYEVSTEGTVVTDGYQWSFSTGSGWNPIIDGGSWSGATTARLSISNTTTSQSGSYHVSVAFTTLNQPGTTTCVETSFSRERNLLVYAPLQAPVISSSQQICAGSQPSALTATPASGGSGSGYSYQWQSGPNGVTWNDITGQTGLSYTPPAPAATTYYRIRSADTGSPSCGTVFSSAVSITINPLPLTSAIYHR